MGESTKRHLHRRSKSMQDDTSINKVKGPNKSHTNKSAKLHNNNNRGKTETFAEAFQKQSRSVESDQLILSGKSIESKKYIKINNLRTSKTEEEIANTIKTIAKRKVPGYD